MNNPYQYPDARPAVSIKELEKNQVGTRYRVEIPSLYGARYLGPSLIKGEYLVPAGRTPMPLAILIHGMGDRSALPCRMIAADLAKKGVASFIVFLIFHSVRATDYVRQHYPNLSAEAWDESYKISVTDIRQVLDWVTTRPEIMNDHISALGISYGSFICSISMALDKRVKKGVLVECGGNSDKITRHSLLLRWRYKLGEETYRQNQAAYALYLKEVAKKGWNQVDAGKPSYLTDPLTFTGELRQRPLMMLNATFDEMIPRASTQELWESLKNPPIHWYPATHASLWAWYPLFRNKITGFIKSDV
jgi:hypothetical protein